MTPYQHPTTEERVALYRLKLIAQEYRKVYAEMPVQMQLTLLTLAENPNISQTDLYTKTGLSSAAMNRHMDVLGDGRPAQGKPGLGLVSRVYDAQDRRKQVVNLTPKGAAVLDTLIHLIQPKA